MNEDKVFSEEVSKLKYKGSHLPWFILGLWAILIVFCGYYLFTYMVPDLVKAFGK